MEKITKKDNINVFIGDSQIAYGNWNELLQTNNILNYGISGDVTSGVLARMEAVIALNPTKVFIQVGTNDLSLDISEQKILTDYQQLLEQLENRSKATIFINSIFPIRDLPGEFYQNSAILSLNRSLKKICTSERVTFIDLFDEFTDGLDNLNDDLTSDGLHLNKKGYMIWANALRKHLI